VAFVQRHPDAAFSEAALRRRLRDDLPEYAIPARLQLVDALPMTATGKVDRRRLETTELPSPTGDAEPVAPVDATQASLASIWREELGLEDLGVRDDFFALGGTSLQAVQIMARIEEQFGRDLTPSVLLEAPSVERLAELIDRDEFDETGSLAVALKPGGSRPPLFCFPGIGGEPIIYKAFVRHLEADQPCYGLQTPGLVGRQRPPDRIANHVGPQLAAIRRIQPKGPYFLAGYSFGSTVAFAAAQRLRAEGERVAVLALIDGSAPGYPKLLPRLSAFHRRLDHWLGWALKENQRGRPSTLIFQSLKTLGRDLECRLLEFVGRPLTRVQRTRRHKRAAVRARGRYRPVPIDAPTLLIRSSPRTPERIFERDALRGWGPFVTQAIEVRDAPGVHLDLMDEPDVAFVVTAINEALAAAHARSRER
jgi:thioesterase domain-containing protein/acyl carrier protein